MTFSELGLASSVVQAIDEMGFKSPTPIQLQAIPIALKGLDLVASAPTGTGKTAAFALPTLSRIRQGSGKPTVLVLEPTRELAAQVHEQFEIFSKHSGHQSALIHGGVGYGGQLQALDGGAEIIIATPGRLIDHVQQKNIDLRSIEILILDEVDRMLDMGFIDDVRWIASQCPRQRQTLFFSATLPAEIRKLAQWALKDPEEITIGLRHTPAETVDHAIFPVDGIQKYDLLLALLAKMDYHSVLIFTRTRRDADKISRWLLDHNHSVTVLHSDRSQTERREALDGFKRGKFEILVATDIASRGLDISDISHVINYNVPQHAEDYVHRIGRTGRAEREGEALTLYSTDETSYLAAIERLIDRPIERRKLEGFAYRNEPLLTHGPQAQKKRRNRGYSVPGEAFGRRR